MKGISKAGVVLAAVAAAMLAGCSQPVPAHLKPLSAEAQALLAEKGMRQDQPIFIRVFKEESELEVWKAKDDGRFHHFKTYPICNWSGKLGPKLKQGDKQAPEGFYRVAARQMNPNSSYHLSFNIGYPNAYDRSYKRTGAHLMVHGDCKSAGCYAMTDALIEEIYALAREAFKGGQQAFDVHAFPFRMTQANMRRHRRHKWARFWHNLKQGYDHFEVARQPSPVAVCEKRYLINVAFVDGRSRVDPAGPCPAYERLPIEQMPPPPIFQEAKGKSPRTPLYDGTGRTAALGAVPATQATMSGASLFTMSPVKPSVAGFAFRLNSTLGSTASGAPGK